MEDIVVLVNIFDVFGNWNDIIFFCEFKVGSSFEVWVVEEVVEDLGDGVYWFCGVKGFCWVEV